MTDPTDSKEFEEEIFSRVKGTLFWIFGFFSFRTITYGPTGLTGFRWPRRVILRHSELFDFNPPKEEFLQQARDFTPTYFEGPPQWARNQVVRAFNEQQERRRIQREENERKERERVKREKPE